MENAHTKGVGNLSALAAKGQLNRAAKHRGKADGSVAGQGSCGHEAEDPGAGTMQSPKESMGGRRERARKPVTRR
jgi:hypothetical protein